MKSKIAATALNPFVLSGTSPPANQRTLSVMASRIIETLINEERPLSEKQLMKLISGRRQKKIAALRSLIRGTKVFRSGSGKKGDPFLYFIHAKAPLSDQRQTVEEIVI